MQARVLGSRADESNSFDAAIVTIDIAESIETRLGFRVPPDRSQPNRQCLEAVLVTSARRGRGRSAAAKGVGAQPDSCLSMFGLCGASRHKAKTMHQAAFGMLL